VRCNPHECPEAQILFFSPFSIAKASPLFCAYLGGWRQRTPALAGRLRPVPK
jgi:hypothetical protein